MRDLQGTVLGQIVSRCRLKIEEAKMRVPELALRSAAEARLEFRPFKEALRAKPPAVIAELKQASPSRGLLRRDYACGEMALQYEHAGAAALSVLTEEDHFRGSLEDLDKARTATTLPVLRKDFILDPYQVYESAARGADALLLIVAALSDEELSNLLHLARLLRIAALVEVHTEEELSRALGAGANLIGINNRNLKTLEVSLDTSFQLVRKVPASCLKISESGIRTSSDLVALYKAGFDAVLMGEFFMTQPEPGAALRDLLDEVQAAPADERK